MRGSFRQREASRSPSPPRRRNVPSPEGLRRKHGRKVSPESPPHRQMRQHSPYRSSPPRVRRSSSHSSPPPQQPRQKRNISQSRSPSPQKMLRASHSSSESPPRVLKKPLSGPGKRDRSHSESPAARREVSPEVTILSSARRQQQVPSSHQKSSSSASRSPSPKRYRQSTSPSSPVQKIGKSMMSRQPPSPTVVRQRKSRELSHSADREDTSLQLTKKRSRSKSLSASRSPSPTQTRRKKSQSPLSKKLRDDTDSNKLPDPSPKKSKNLGKESQYQALLSSPECLSKTQPSGGSPPATAGRSEPPTSMDTDIAPAADKDYHQNKSQLAVRSDSAKKKVKSEAPEKEKKKKKKKSSSSEVKKKKKIVFCSRTFFCR